MSELANTVFCQTWGSETNYRCLTIDVDNTLVHIWHTSIKRPPLLSGHLAIPRGWPLNRGSTVVRMLLTRLRRKENKLVILTVYIACFVNNIYNHPTLKKSNSYCLHENYSSLNIYFFHSPASLITPYIYYYYCNISDNFESIERRTQFWVS